MNNDKIFLTDAGIETVLIFQEGVELPCFASFDLLKNEDGRETLRRYYRTYAKMAVDSQMGFVIETPTWRASYDWGRELGYDEAAIDRVNREAVKLVTEIRDEFETPESPFVVSGNVGPRGDGYVADAQMTVEEAQDYHASQIGVFAEGNVQSIAAITLNYVEEAIGIARAANEAGLPVVIGFTTETDGRLPDGTSLEAAITATDAAADVAWYMINCAHVEHFRDALQQDAEWTHRVRAVRANASRLSHAELDESEVLDDGDPQEFGAQYAELREAFPEMTVFGGCCGTDHRHIDATRHALA